MKIVFEVKGISAAAARELFGSVEFRLVDILDDYDDLWAGRPWEDGMNWRTIDTDGAMYQWENKPRFIQVEWVASGGDFSWISTVPEGAEFDAAATLQGRGA